MRRMQIAIASTLLLLGSATATRADLESDISRCEEGLDRNVAVCNATHPVGEAGWTACLNTSLSTHRTCVADAVRRMQALNPAGQAGT